MNSEQWMSTLALSFLTVLLKCCYILVNSECVPQHCLHCSSDTVIVVLSCLSVFSESWILPTLFILLFILFFLILFTFIGSCTGYRFCKCFGQYCEDSFEWCCYCYPEKCIFIHTYRYIKSHIYSWLYVRKSLHVYIESFILRDLYLYH